MASSVSSKTAPAFANCELVQKQMDYFAIIIHFNLANLRYNNLLYLPLVTWNWNGPNIR
jgi:hypothetical protein